MRKGPIFTNIVLADEINRAPAKVQSALLEAMQERQVTIGDQTFKLDDPFLCWLPKIQLNMRAHIRYLRRRWTVLGMFKLNITYPDKKEEREIMERMALTKRDFNVNPVISPKDILRLRSLVDEIYIDDKIKDYIIDIVFAIAGSKGV